MSEKFRDMLGASSMILMMVAVIILGLGIKNILTVLPASAYEDKGVHTFTPIEILPSTEKEHFLLMAASRRMHPTTTVYKVRYEATDGSGYRCSFEAGLHRDIRPAAGRKRRYRAACPLYSRRGCHRGC